MKNVEAYIGFGSNQGDRQAFFCDASAGLDAFPETRVVGVSRLYETKPVNISDNGGWFLNGVILLDTALSPEDLIRRMRELERSLGKSPDHRSDRSRPVDLDLLLYGDRVISSEDLQVPHPRMLDRAFVLVPLAETAPQLIHPISGLTMAESVSRLPQEEMVEVRPYD